VPILLGSSGNRAGGNPMRAISHAINRGGFEAVVVPSYQAVD
jgi:hypothetical protein